MCVCETAPTIRLFEVKALCQVPFSSQHSFPPLFFFFKTHTHTHTHTQPDLRTLDAVGTDWPQQFLLVLPKREEWRQESPEDSGRVGGGKMPRKGKGEWGHSRRGCSITLLPFMLWDRGSFAQFGVTAAVFAVAEPEFELSAALGNRKPHSLS